MDHPDIFIHRHNIIIPGFPVIGRVIGIHSHVIHAEGQHQIPRTGFGDLIDMLADVFDRRAFLRKDMFHLQSAPEKRFTTGIPENIGIIEIQLLPQIHVLRFFRCHLLPKF